MLFNHKDYTYQKGVPTNEFAGQRSEADPKSAVDRESNIAKWYLVNHKY